MAQPLLAEEMFDLTVDQLVNDYGAELSLEEHWWGYSYDLRLSGHTLYSAPADFVRETEDLLETRDLFNYEDDNIV